MNFRAAHLPALLALATALPAFGAEPLVALRPHHPAPGESVLVRTSTSSHDGTITVHEGTKQRSGTIEISRNRTIERSITGTGKKEKLGRKDNACHFDRLCDQNRIAPPGRDNSYQPVRKHLGNEDQNKYQSAESIQ